VPRTRESFLVFGAPAIEEDEIEEVVATLRSGWIGTGPKVAQFEQEFRDYRRAPHAVALASCTAALHLAILAAGVGEGDEVLVPGLTFAATANSVIHAGATPVVVDCDPVTMNIDLADAAAKLTERTTAIVPVHFAGRPCDMTALCALAEAHDLRVIEDCAHAIETEFDGRPAGTFGDFGCFSFYVTKNVVTGEGGMVLTRREEDAARIKVLGLHGMSKDAWTRFGDDGYKHYDVVESGFKYNMMDLQAALGIHQLRRVERNWERRREIWNRYQSALTGLPLDLPAEPEPGTRHAHHLYTVLVGDESGAGRDRFIDAMTRSNIGVGVHYRALSEHPFYQRTLGWSEASCPAATAIGRRTVSLPLSPALTDDDVEDVVAAVERALLSRPAA
jgi:dTDP-4-amino-4,6-dideoxygalactose transaminase